MNIKKYYKILVIAFFTSHSVYSDYSKNDETVEFIDYMTQKHGYEKWYYENGTIKSEQEFDYGNTKSGIIRWNFDGTLLY